MGISGDSHSEKTGFHLGLHLKISLTTNFSKALKTYMIRLYLKILQEKHEAKCSAPSLQSLCDCKVSAASHRCWGDGGPRGSSHSPLGSSRLHWQHCTHRRGLLTHSQHNYNFTFNSPHFQGAVSS